MLHVEQEVKICIFTISCALEKTNNDNFKYNRVWNLPRTNGYWSKKMKVVIKHK